MAGIRCRVQARTCAFARGRRCGTDANQTTRTGRRKEWRRFDGIPPRPRHVETFRQEIGRGTRDVVANQGMQDGGETEETQVRNLPSDGNGARHRDVAGTGQEDAGRDHVREDVEREAFGIQAMPKVRIWGCGSAVPERQVSNDELALRMDTSDEWIAARTGIRNRRVVKQGQDLVELAATAARNAMERAQVDPVELDLVILATSSPDDLFGSACQLQHALGARNACAFDLTAACSGFVLATVTAAQYVRTGACRKVLVVGADALSRCVDWNDRGTCILFGDAAGAVLVTAHEEGTGTTKDADGTTPPRTDPTVGSCALLAFDMRSDGGGNRHLTARYLNPEDGDRTKPDGAERDRPASYANVRMNGQDVFKFAVRAVPATLKASAEKAGIGPEEFADKVDWLVLHQANQRILDAAADRLGFPKERVVSNLAHYGNTSAASIPLALDEAVRQGKIRPGDTVAIAGFGAGLTWASAIFRWG